MGIPLTMEPNYDDFSCQFSFGRTPPPEVTLLSCEGLRAPLPRPQSPPAKTLEPRCACPQEKDPILSSPCFAKCPTRKRKAPEGDRGYSACHKVV